MPDEPRIDDQTPAPSARRRRTSQPVARRSVPSRELAAAQPTPPDWRGASDCGSTGRCTIRFRNPRAGPKCGPM